MPSQIHVGDSGTPFQYQCLDQSNVAINVASTQLMQVTYTRPDGTSLVVTPTFLTTGVDGWIQYVVQPNDLNQAGFWRAQVYLSFAGNRSWHSDTKTFQVWPNP